MSEEMNKIAAELAIALEPFATSDQYNLVDSDRNRARSALSRYVAYMVEASKPMPPNKQHCKACGGAGQVVSGKLSQELKCTRCNGTGSVETQT